jgi:hypothetical protein
MLTTSSRSCAQSSTSGTVAGASRQPADIASSRNPARAIFAAIDIP